MGHNILYTKNTKLCVRIINKKMFAQLLVLERTERLVYVRMAPTAESAARAKS